MEENYAEQFIVLFKRLYGLFISLVYARRLNSEESEDVEKSKGA